MMFGPNAVVSAGRWVAPFHHRGSEFEDLIGDLERLFLEKISGPGWRLGFVTGSGTLGLEVLAHGWRAADVVTAGEFSDRLVRSLRHANRYQVGAQVRMGVLYETSESRPASPLAETHLVDAVSALPFYELPASAVGFATVSSKQIGAEPIIAIVGVRSESEAGRCSCDTYACLGRWLWATSQRRALHSPALSAMVDLRDRMLALDVAEHRRSLTWRRRAIETAAALVGAVNADRGDGPVVTFEAGALSEDLVRRWGLYQTRRGCPQVFLWSGTEEQHQEFARELGREESWNLDQR